MMSRIRMSIPRRLADRIQQQQQPRLLFSTSSPSASPSTTDTDTSSEQQRRRLDIAIVGTPNAGKSQLLNIMTRSTVAAVSRKRHTTRGGILGARTFNDECQLVFWDTPGYLRDAQAEGLDDAEIMESAISEMETVDYSLLVIDAARQMTDDYKETMISLMMHGLFKSEGREEAAISSDGTEFIPERPAERLGIILNKVDLVSPKTDLLEMAEIMGNAAEACIEYYLQEYNQEEMGGAAPPTLEELFPPIFYTNALTGEGTEDILKHLQQLATPCLDWPVDASESTLMSPVERVEEVIREKIYRTLHKEVPHAVRQVNRLFLERPGGIIEIQQDIVVKSKSHYAIVSGRNLSTIQQMAQRDLQTSIFPGKKVVLHLHLKQNKSQHLERNSRADVQGTMEYRRAKR